MFHLKMIEYRKKNMMTQEELADRLGVSRQTITKWEKGTILPSLEYLIDLSRLFGVIWLRMMIVYVKVHIRFTQQPSRNF